jgi:hypothetical protein
MMNRRSFLGAASMASAGLLSSSSQILQAVPQATTEINKVSIRDVKTAAIKIKSYKTHLVKIITDSGCKKRDYR